MKRHSRGEGYQISQYREMFFGAKLPHLCYCQTPVFGLGLGVEFTFAWDNKNNDNNDNNNDNNDNNYNNDNDKNNPPLNFVKGTRG